MSATIFCPSACSLFSPSVTTRTFPSSGDQKEMQHLLHFYNNMSVRYNRRKCTSLGESRSSTVPAVSLEHATSDRATMLALGSGSVVTPRLFPKCWRILGQDDAVFLHYTGWYMQIPEVIIINICLYQGSARNRRALISEMSWDVRRLPSSAAAPLLCDGPPPALSVLSH